MLALSPGELLPCLRLCLNRPGAPSEGLELGIGESLLTRALAQATGTAPSSWGHPLNAPPSPSDPEIFWGGDVPAGRQLAQIRSEAQDKGDLGLVAESSRCTQRTVVAPAPLSAAGVLGKLREMATMSGNAVSARIKRVWGRGGHPLRPRPRGCQRCFGFRSRPTRRSASSRGSSSPAGTRRRATSSGEG